MKLQRPILFLAVGLLVFVQTGWAQDKYTPKENEELFGRWKFRTINEQKVIDSVGWKIYYGTSNDVLLDEATLQIESKWTDERGNIWYKVLGVFSGSSSEVGNKFQILYMVNKSNTKLWEKLNMAIEYDPSNYPTENGSATTEYFYDRASK